MLLWLLLQLIHFAAFPLSRLGIVKASFASPLAAPSALTDYKFTTSSLFCSLCDQREQWRSFTRPRRALYREAIGCVGRIDINNLNWGLSKFPLFEYC